MADIELRDLCQVKVEAMKFNHSIQFNAVPEWRSKYIDYSNLKKVIYALEKQAVPQGSAGSSSRNEEETAGLISSDPVSLFTKLLDKELQKISEFYADTEPGIYRDFDLLVQDVNKFENDTRHVGSPLVYATTPSLLPRVSLNDTHVARDSLNISDNAAPSSPEYADYPDRDGESDEEEDTAKLLKAQLLSDQKITLKRRCISSYVSLSELKSYVELNKTGFSKSLKKFDKILLTDLRMKYISDVVLKSYPFMESTERTLDSKINEAIGIYSFLVTKGDVSEAERQLKLHLREHIVWERNTVWRDMIDIERKSHGTKVQQPVHTLEFVQVGSKFRLPVVLFSSGFLKFLVITLIFFAFLAFPVFESTSQSNCLAIIVAASLLWATEAMPLFVTSLLVPFLVVVLRVPRNEETGHRMSAPEASKYIFSQMFSSVIMILLGGFTLAAALSKYQIAKSLATMILSRAGTNPRVILLTLMFVSTFLSMWISNVASPVLCYSLAQPLLRTIPSDSGFAKAIVLGIALASNVGGMVSPIASPQNIIALENMDPEPSWGQWFLISIPVSGISLFLIWVVLIVTFKLNNAHDGAPINHIHATKDRFTVIQWFICAVTIVTIVFWCFSHQLEPYVGEMGVLALIPVVIFFGTGLLSAADFNNFLWTIIALAMGGIALGKAVSSSGLLATIATAIEQRIHGMGLYGVLLIFGMMVLVIATFVSHTVAALICFPLIESVGKQMPDPHPVLLVMASAFLASAAMGLPTSGFPNVTAICMTDELGKPYLTVQSFIGRGVLASLLVYVVVITVGYALMKMCGF